MENTLPAFEAAAALGVAVQEFDVRQLRCGALVCVHDEDFDRTSDAAAVLGAGKPVRACTLDEVRRLDCGDGARVPTLEEALAVMLPGSVPLIEHKGGDADRYVEELQRLGVSDRVVLQSFDWRFLQRVAALAPQLALGALGPNPIYAEPDDEVLALLRGFGAEVLHWRADALTRRHVELAHAAGLLAFSYTTDEPEGWRRGRELGLDAMCTNDPAAMQGYVSGA